MLHSSVAQDLGETSLYRDVMPPKPECFLLPCGPAELRKLHTHGLSAFPQGFSAFLILQAKQPNWLVLFYSRQWNVSIETSVLGKDPGCCSNGTAFLHGLPLPWAKLLTLPQQKQTYNSPKTNTGVTIRFCDYHSQVITTTLC